MTKQKNLMMFQILAAAVYGIWFVFAPGSYHTMMGATAEAITPLANANLSICGFGLFALTYAFWKMREMISAENGASIMGVFAVAWLVYGLGGLYLAFLQGALSLANKQVDQGLLFLVLAAYFYASRAPAAAPAE